MSDTDILVDLNFSHFSIPERMWGGLTRWIHRGIRPGSFLMAVLSNDLNMAVRKADDDNIVIISHYIAALDTMAPDDCWGSVEITDAWAKKFADERKLKDAADAG